MFATPGNAASYKKEKEGMSGIGWASVVHCWKGLTDYARGRNVTPRECQNGEGKGERRV